MRILYTTVPGAVRTGTCSARVILVGDWSLFDRTRYRVFVWYQVLFLQI
jgi:hypothetical protein